jgi:molybdopterin-guanine dinucleotide biosynthesis protein A
MDIEGFILVGGASSRMGRDKARLTILGHSFVERIGEAMRPVAGRVSTVGAKERDAFPAYGNVPDMVESWGALGGLHAALEGCAAAWALVAACDLPFVTGELFRRLVMLREDSEAVVPVQRDGRLQPLCALYRTMPCREMARRMIEQGERRPRALIERVRARKVSWDEISDLEGASLFFMNVNTPEDYRQARSSFGEVTD